MMPISKYPIVVIACQVFQDLFARFANPETLQKFVFLDYGLHRVPLKLNQAVQEALDALLEPSMVVLGYGLCGNGLNGILAGKHTLLISRADDCIAILLGSYARYMREFNAEAGTYYLTKGWLESGSNPLQEYQEYIQKYGAKMADFLIDSLYHNYKRLVFVAHGQADLEKYRPRAQEVAKFCSRWDFRYEEILGSTQFFENLLERASAPGQSDENFVVVPPGGELRQEEFLRLET
ncbi:MAG TPA: DUF1638 domain-containing protein [Anaerolineales bacterium]